MVAQIPKDSHLVLSNAGNALESLMVDAHVLKVMLCFFNRDMVITEQFMNGDHWNLTDGRTNGAPGKLSQS